MKRRLLIAAPLLAAVLVAALVLALGGDLTLVLVVLLGGLVGSLLGLLALHHRVVSGQLGQSRRRLRAVLQGVERLERGQAASARADRSEALVRSVGQHQREVREQAAELSRQLAALGARVEELGAEHQDGLAQVTSSVAALGSQVGQVVSTTKPAPPRRPEVQSAHVIGEEMMQDLVLDAAAPSVVLALDSFTPGQLFAGVRTAVAVAARTARLLGRPLRLVVMRQPKVGADELLALLRDVVGPGAGSADLSGRLTISLPDSPDKRAHRDDVWVATYWSTAHAIGLAVDEGSIRGDKVLYLVQDYEPGFFAWGVQHAMARATYDRGFTLLVNSAPLAEFLSAETGLEVPVSQVFAPQVDTQRLHAAAASWQPSGDPTRPRVFFYARPAKPRNLYALGISALEAWLGALPDGIRPQLTLAGEHLEPPDLGPGVDLDCVGMVDLDGYYDLLTRQDLALALMHSPHPSHLPLELPMAGIPTVTNTLGRHRRAWVPGLAVAEATPVALARALELGRVAAHDLHTHTPQQLPHDLGLPLESVVDAAVRGLGDRTVTR